MADLNEAIRLLADPTEMMEVALVLTGRHFGASRMVFAEIDPATLSVAAYRQYVDGAPEFPSDITLDDFGEAALDHLRRGHTLAVEDVMTDERTAAGVEAFKRIETRALLAVPLTSPAVCWRSLPFTTVPPASGPATRSSWPSGSLN